MISIITITKDNKKELKRTINSIYNQKNFRGYEHIIIDASRKPFDFSEYDCAYRRTVRYVFEEDSGIYFAMNKGLEKCTNEYTVFLNSGDEFSRDDVLCSVASNLESNSDGIVYFSDLILRRSRGQGDIIRKFSKSTIMLHLLRLPAHPCMFVPTRIAKEVGFDIRYSICADHKYKLRVLQNNKIHKLENAAVRFYEGGVSSDLKFRNICIAFNERLRIELSFYRPVFWLPLIVRGLLIFVSRSLRSSMMWVLR